MFRLLPPTNRALSMSFTCRKVILNIKKIGLKNSTGPAKVATTCTADGHKQTTKAGTAL
jgi:hypothetical protein